MSRWYEVYQGCGCVSLGASSKVRLLGYCAQHGSSRNQLFKDNVLVWRGGDAEVRPTGADGREG